MGYGIVATFDEGLRNELLGLMDCFREQRIGKTPKDFGEPPHLTLALFLDASIDVQALASACEHMRTQKLEVLLHVFGSFVAEEAQAVIYLNPALSTELGALHLGLYEEFDRLGLRDHHEHFRPGQWVPPLYPGRRAYPGRLPQGRRALPGSTEETLPRLHHEPQDLGILSGPGVVRLRSEGYGVPCDTSPGKPENVIFFRLVPLRRPELA